MRDPHCGAGMPVPAGPSTYLNAAAMAVPSPLRKWRPLAARPPGSLRGRTGGSGSDRGGGATVPSPPGGAGCSRRHPAGGAAASASLSRRAGAPRLPRAMALPPLPSLPLSLPAAALALAALAVFLLVLVRAAHGGPGGLRGGGGAGGRPAPAPLCGAGALTGVPALPGGPPVPPRPAGGRAGPGWAVEAGRAALVRGVVRGTCFCKAWGAVSAKATKTEHFSLTVLVGKCPDNAFALNIWEVAVFLRIRNALRDLEVLPPGKENSAACATVPRMHPAQRGGRGTVPGGV